MMEAGIPIAARAAPRSSGAREGRLWWKQLPAPRAASLSPSDDRFRAAAQSELEPCLGDYARRHQGELIA